MTKENFFSIKSVWYYNSLLVTFYLCRKNIQTT